jgi:hypothetical protein
MLEQLSHADVPALKSAAELAYDEGRADGVAGRPQANFYQTAELRRQYQLGYDTCNHSAMRSGLRKALSLQDGTKGCPDCGKRPEAAEIAPGCYEVACYAHGSSLQVRVAASSLAIATARWNDDADWQKMGANPRVRPVFKQTV